MKSRPLRSRSSGISVDSQQLLCQLFLEKLPGGGHVVTGAELDNRIETGLHRSTARLLLVGSWGRPSSLSSPPFRRSHEVRCGPSTRLTNSNLIGASPWMRSKNGAHSPSLCPRPVKVTSPLLLYPCPSAPRPRTFPPRPLFPSFAPRTVQRIMLSDFGQGREEEARAIKPTFYFFLSSTAYGAITIARVFSCRTSGGSYSSHRTLFLLLSWVIWRRYVEANFAAKVTWETPFTEVQRKMSWLYREIGNRSNFKLLSAWV